MNLGVKISPLRPLVPNINRTFTFTQMLLAEYFCLFGIILGGTRDVWKLQSVSSSLWNTQICSPSGTKIRVTTFRVFSIPLISPILCWLWAGASLLHHDNMHECIQLQPWLGSTLSLYAKAFQLLPFLNLLQVIEPAVPPSLPAQPGTLVTHVVCLWTSCVMGKETAPTQLMSSRTAPTARAIWMSLPAQTVFAFTFHISKQESICFFY